VANLGALWLAVLGVDHVGVAGALVAGVLAGAGGDAVALAAADVAHLVTHLVLPVPAATRLARRRAICRYMLRDQRCMSSDIQIR
jgi:hypothetical protein